MKLIFIISEDYIFFAILNQFFKLEFPDCTIKGCSSFAEVQNNIKSHTPDLIISHGVMSGVASFEIVNYLRIEKKLKVPIFFVSEVRVHSFQLKAFEVGVNDFFEKPFDPYEIKEYISQALNL